jgi:hypothetical protein
MVAAKHNLTPTVYKLISRLKVSIISMFHSPWWSLM